MKTDRCEAEKVLEKSSFFIILKKAFDLNWYLKKNTAKQFSSFRLFIRYSIKNIPGKPWLTGSFINRLLRKVFCSPEQEIKQRYINNSCVQIVKVAARGKSEITLNAMLKSHLYHKFAKPHIYYLKDLFHSYYYKWCSWKALGKFQEMNVEILKNCSELSQLLETLDWCIS